MFCEHWPLLFQRLCSAHSKPFEVSIRTRLVFVILSLLYPIATTTPPQEHTQSGAHVNGMDGYSP